MPRRFAVMLTGPQIARAGRVLMSVLVLASAAGCVKHSIIPDGEESDTITIRISNNNVLDMTVYAVNQSMRVRLGTVTTSSSQRFTVSLRQISPTGELQLLADPIGSRRGMTSETIHVFAGQAVDAIREGRARGRVPNVHGLSQWEGYRRRGGVEHERWHVDITRRESQLAGRDRLSPAGIPS